jgi:hypothetical protein
MESVRTDPRALNPAGGAERVGLPPLPSLPAQHGIAGLRKAWAIAGILVGVLCYGCVGGGPHGGEPGSRHLNADEERLLALIPEGIRTTCVTRYEDWFERTEPVLHVATEGHGAAIAGLFCTWRPQGNAPDDDRGILRLTYLLFPTRAAMEGDYWGNWVGPWDFGTDCLENALAELSYRTTSGRTGRLLCHGDRRFQPELAWTDDQRLVITNAFQIPFPDLDREDLYRWWREQVGPGRVVLAPGAEQPKHARCLGKAATIVGDDRANHLTGTPGEDVIVGFAGEDLIDGLDGKDLVCAGEGNDRVVGGGGNDVLSGGPGDDWLGADPGLWDKASFEDSTSPVRIHLAERSARGEGHDLLIGIDDLRGSRFNDVLVGDAGWNDIEGFGGDDVIAGGEGGDFLDGGPGNDRIQGGDGNDYLYGYEGLDHLDGGPGRDHLYNYWSGTDVCIAGEKLKCGPS